ncbi:hypothetical protein ABID82_002282 [Methylobacterium sp. PvP062]|uniref:Uncharacterized protein n=1 Tax=Methylobacterium radiotolerans TaxID=31998 RepID=A0ABV2NMY6_9HYPH|nr:MULTISPECIES: hypothetical protein [unclassified Methylobacterium]MBP2495385.1 hypothetical protein [Methylobacterium sp. PvP105]MBP2504744.1 hypothetical protein [Methylobacterium sp. PvP109]MCX7335754.1 hypothetical protein [Hyphomicrobiales bacterium]
MARATRLRPLSRDLTLAVQRALAPQERQRLIASAARRVLAETQAQNARAIGRTPPHDTFVDGRAEAPLESVNPDRGEIVFRFSLATELFEWIDEQLIIHSPVGRTPKSPQYSKSHVFFADGEQADPAAPVSGEVFVFLSTVPYARKIERGLSPQAPEGVYEVVAALAQRRFGNLARIRFTFRSFQEGAIVYNVGKYELRQKFGRAAAHDIIKRERDTRQPAIVITMR